MYQNIYVTAGGVTGGSLPETIWNGSYCRIRFGESTMLPFLAAESWLRLRWEAEFPDAFLLYPEYYERYDTIAPAHIFGLNIEGEGFRARQCFRGDMIDFAAYDAIFGKACAEESVTTLGRMSLDRLMTPVSLSESSRLACR